MSYEYKDPVQEAWRKQGGGYSSPPDGYLETWIAARLAESDLRWKDPFDMVHRVIIWQPKHWPRYYRLICKEAYVSGSFAITFKGVTCLECLGIGG